MEAKSAINGNFQWLCKRLPEGIGFLPSQAQGFAAIDRYIRCCWSLEVHRRFPAQVPDLPAMYLGSPS